MGEIAFDGFLSRSRDGELFSHDLDAHLYDQFRIRICTDATFQRLEEQKDHEKAAKEQIRSASVFILILAPNRFDRESTNRSETDQPFQQREAVYAFAEAKRRMEHEPERPLGIFIVHLTDDFSDDFKDEANAFVGKIDGGSSKMPNTFYAPCSQDAAKGARYDALHSIASAVQSFMSDRGYKKAAYGAAEQSGFGTSLDEADRGYLIRNLSYWCLGHPSAVRRPDGDKATETARKILFDFDSQRALRLEASVSATNSKEAERAGSDVTLRPVLDLLVDASDGPLLVTGNAGSGKTTSLATAAAFLASRYGSEFEMETEQLRASDFSESVSFASNSDMYFPIVMTASSLSEDLIEHGDTTDLYSDYDAFTAHLCRLFDPNPAYVATESDIRAMQDKFKTTSFAFYIDGLDDVTKPGLQTRILNLAKHIWSRFDKHSANCMIVISSRNLHDAATRMTHAKIEPLRMSQIAKFFDLFVGTFSDSPERTKSDLWDQYGEQASDDNFLSLPFYLNCFCYIVSMQGSAPGQKIVPNTQAGLLGMIVGYLTESLPELVERKLHGLPVTAPMYRTILRRLAFDALYQGPSQRTLGKSEAVQSIKHTASTIFELRPSHGQIL